MDRKPSRLTAGAVAGVVGGVVVWAWFCLGALARGQDVWPVFKGAALPILGERVMLPGFDVQAVTVGGLCHLAISAGWGILFALLFHGLTRELTIVAGLLWGVIVWVTMYYVVLPLVGAGAVVEHATTWSAIVNHLVFGLGLGVGYLPFQEPVRPPLDRDVGVRP